jgi:hypothetical protein
MDRFAAHLVATTVLTAALAAVPTAMAGSTPSQPPAAAAGAAAPDPGGPMLEAPGAAGSAKPAPVLAAPPSTPRASSPAAQPVPCTDSYQVGKTVYAYWHGIIAFSVKQFYSPSCHARYGYAFPWLQFRDQHVSYDLGMAVFDVTHDAIDGPRTFIKGAGGPDFWSEPVAVGSISCTEGLAHVFYSNDETDTYTGELCR